MSRSLRILITNDDGIGAEGLVAMEHIARALSDDVWVVAPEVEQSGASRALTLSQPLRVRRLGDQRFAVDGTPTDCVLLAVQDLIKDGRPDRRSTDAASLYGRGDPYRGQGRLGAHPGHQ